MRIIRYLLLVLLAFAPGYAYAQQDSVVVRVGDLEFPAYPALFGQPFEQNVGPAPLAAIEPAIGCEEDPADPGTFIPAVDNPEELEGNIALISRGSCAFVLKAQAAAQAGAIAYIVYNDDRVPPGDMSLVNMSGDCEPDVCSAPGVFVSRASGLALLMEEEFGSEAVLNVLYDPPPPPPTVGTHDTGLVELDVFDYGFIGTDVDFGGTGFTFGGENGLFVGSVLVGIDGNVVSNPFDGFSEWTVVSEVEPIAPPVEGVCPGVFFDTGFETSFESTDLGVRVTERSYSRDSDPYVILELDVENVSGVDISDAFIGLFADWDVGDFAENEAAVDEDLNLVYVYDATGTSPYYYGVVAVGPLVQLSGYSADATTADDAQLFEALTTDVEVAPGPANRVAVIGLGPFDITAGSSVRTYFALVAGYDELDLIATASGFQAPCPLATEASTPEGTFRLDSVYPNPLSSHATISFTLPAAQDVRLAVYDVLGREVAMLADGVRAAGEQAVAFDASALPSGVYLVRLEAGTVRLVERVTVVR